MRKPTRKKIVLGALGGILLAMALWHLAWGPCRTWWDWRVQLARPLSVPLLLTEHGSRVVVRQKHVAGVEYLMACIPEEIASVYQGAFPTVEERLPGTVGLNQRALLPQLFLLNCEARRAVPVDWKEWQNADGQVLVPDERDYDDIPMLTSVNYWPHFRGQRMSVLGEQALGRFYRTGMPVFGLSSRGGPRNVASGAFAFLEKPAAHYAGPDYFEWREKTGGTRVGKGYQLACSASLWPDHSPTARTITPDLRYYIQVRGDRVWIIPAPGTKAAP